MAHSATRRTSVPLGRTIMVQGTASHVGKSTVVTALCRLFAREGLRVAPFKAQNMSLNAAVTPDGGEIGRAQYVQAEAAGVIPSVLMNPVLLKPTDQRRSQVIVLGEARTVAAASDYYALKAELWPIVTRSLDALRASHDVVVIEGAGSPAEINLAQYDIVNMRVARHAAAPVLLVGDIERGGVFAALYGTTMLLTAEERALVRGYIINKFRGDPSLLAPGLEMLRARTGVPTLGVLPFASDLGIAEEDSLGMSNQGTSGRMVLDVAVIALPHIANFDDFDPLRREPGVRVRYVSRADELGTTDADLIVLPGSKSTVGDLRWLRERGLDAAVVQRHQEGIPVIGICGGYQMLGLSIDDPCGVESSERSVAGLALLPVRTTFAPRKVTSQVRTRIADGRGLLRSCEGMEVRGYEIHMGATVADPATTGGTVSPFQVVERGPGGAGHPTGGIGCSDADGQVIGTYLHGFFANHGVRRALLANIAARKGVALPLAPPLADPDVAYDALAAMVSEHLDMDVLHAMVDVGH